MKSVMKNAIKRSLVAGLAIALLLGILFTPGLPWSARSHHLLRRLNAKVEMRVAAWQGERPRLISLAGKVVARKAGKEVLKGAEIEALDSVSGWAAITDSAGEFVLPDLIWYPGAQYSLVIIANDYQARQFQVSAPASYSPDGVVSIGELEFDRGCAIDVAGLPGRSSISYVKYDKENTAYYRALFDEMTRDKQTNEEKLDAINRYVASKLIAGDDAEDYQSPLQVLEQGSRYSGKLALAVATIAESGNYKTRILDLIDRAPQPTARMVTEVYYGDQWHMYDPAIGEVFRKKDGTVASYKELIQDYDVICSDLAPKICLHRQYRSGIHHYYYLTGR